MKKNFIVFEGIDGAGKSTQTELLAKRLRKERIPFSRTRAPYYDSPTGQLVRRALHGEFGDFVGLNPYLSSMPYFLDYAASQPRMLKLLKKGLLISDRYIPSSCAYQAAKLPAKDRAKLIELTESILYGIFKLPEPDLVIYLDAPVALAQRNMRSKKKDQYEKNTAYQRKVADVYRELARRKNWRVIQCAKRGEMLSPEEIHEKVWKAVQ